MIAKTFVTNGNLFKNVPYDPVKSFAPVVKLATGSIVLAVHPSVPADSVATFIQYVKARYRQSCDHATAATISPCLGLFDTTGWPLF